MVKHTRFIVLLLFTISSNYLHSQQTFAGYVFDLTSKEPLIGASVTSESVGKGTTSNNQGYFILHDMQPGDTVTFSYIGYTQETYIIGTISKVTNIFLKEGVELGEVIVEWQKNPVINQDQGVISIPLKLIEKLPRFLGEADAIKALTLLPGVTNGYQNSVGIFVRGGTPDQNLILLDGASVYNSSHLYGFISAFNSDVISNLKLYKGYMPTEFGDRMSSVMDVSVKNGDKSRKHLNLSLGIISSRFLFESPIGQKHRTSVLMAGRASYLNLFTQFRKRKFQENQVKDYTNYNLYDFNLKVNHKLDEKSYISFSIFKNQDNYIFKESRLMNSFDVENIRWGNNSTSLLYHRILSDRLFLKSSFAISDYKSSYSDEEFYYVDSLKHSTAFNTGIRSFIHKSYVQLGLSANQEIKMGYEMKWEKLIPSTITEAEFGESLTENLWGLNENINNFAFYINDHISFNNSFGIDIGVRASHLTSADYQTFNLEPRVQLEFKPLTQSFSAYTYYNRNFQTAFLLSSNGLGLASDFWIPTVAEYPQSFADHFGAGFQLQLSKPFSISLDGYYKFQRNLISLKDGADYYNVEIPITDKVIKGGKGKSYGMEALFKWEYSKSSGWLSYTLSKTTRQFDAINDGDWYPFKYDQRHRISAIYNWSPNQKWDISAVFNFNTGIAVTLPETFILNEERNSFIPFYKGVNQYRFPAFHQLDLSFNRNFKHSTLSFGLFNAYAKFNPITYTLETKKYIVGQSPNSEHRGVNFRLAKRGIPYPLPFISYTYEIL